MIRKYQKRLHSQKGATVVEYVLLITTAAMLIAGGAGFFAQRAKEEFMVKIACNPYALGGGTRGSIHRTDPNVCLDTWVAHYPGWLREQDAGGLED